MFFSGLDCSYHKCRPYTVRFWFSLLGCGNAGVERPADFWDLRTYPGDHFHGRAWSCSLRPRTASSFHVPSSFCPLPPFNLLVFNSAVSCSGRLLSSEEGMQDACQKVQHWSRNILFSFSLKGQQGGRGQSIKLHKAAVLAGSYSNSICRTLQTV